MIRLLMLLFGVCSFMGGEINAREDVGVVEVNLTYACKMDNRTRLIPVTYTFPYFIKQHEGFTLARF